MDYPHSYACTQACACMHARAYSLGSVKSRGFTLTFNLSMKKKQPGGGREGGRETDMGCAPGGPDQEVLPLRADLLGWGSPPALLRHALRRPPGPAVLAHSLSSSLPLLFPLWGVAPWVWRRSVGRLEFPVHGWGCPCVSPSSSSLVQKEVYGPCFRKSMQEKTCTQLFFPDGKSRFSHGKFLFPSVVQETSCTRR